MNRHHFMSASKEKCVTATLNPTRSSSFCICVHMCVPQTSSLSSMLFLTSKIQPVRLLKSDFQRGTDKIYNDSYECEREFIVFRLFYSISTQLSSNIQLDDNMSAVREPSKYEGQLKQLHLLSVFRTEFVPTANRALQSTLERHALKRADMFSSLHSV